MWPSPAQWARVNYVPNCDKNGSHRWGAIHLLKKHQDIQFRTCKRCGRKEYTQFAFIDGKIVEKVLKVSTPDDVVDKST